MHFVTFCYKDNFESWKKILFNKREFRETDRVCERHFDRSQILTHWTHIIDGQICQLEREKPKIRPNAVPHLNLPETDEQSQIVNNKREPRNGKKRKQSLNSLENPKKVCLNAITIAVRHNYIIIYISDLQVIKKDEGIECEAIDNLEDDVEIVQTELRSSKSTPKDDRVEPMMSSDDMRQIFDTVYDDIYEIVLPNTLWGIHRDPEERQFIAFSMFDVKQMCSSIAVKVTDTFELKVYVNGKERSTETLKELSVDSITKLLNHLNESSNVESK